MTPHPGILGHLDRARPGLPPLGPLQVIEKGPVPQPAPSLFSWLFARGLIAVLLGTPAPAARRRAHRWSALPCTPWAPAHSSTSTARCCGAPAGHSSTRLWWPLASHPGASSPFRGCSTASTRPWGRPFRRSPWRGARRSWREGGPPTPCGRRATPRPTSSSAWWPRTPGHCWPSTTTGDGPPCWPPRRRTTWCCRSPNGWGSTTCWPPATRRTVAATTEGWPVSSCGPGASWPRSAAGRRPTRWS